MVFFNEVKTQAVINQNYSALLVSFFQLCESDATHHITAARCMEVSPASNRISRVLSGETLLTE